MARTGKQEWMTLEQIEALAKKLKQMPPLAKSEQKKSKQEAVAMLTDEIAGLREKGYSLEQVVEVLRESELTLTVPTLKSYLQRAKQHNEGKEAAEKPPRKPRKPKADAAVTPPAEEADASSGKRGPLVDSQEMFDQDA